MKTDEERRIELLAFDKLTGKQQQEAVEKLKGRVKAINQEICSKGKETADSQEDLRKLEEEVASAKNQYSEARARRQRLFAAKMSTEQVDGEIRSLTLDLEDREALCADKAAGLRNRISDLSNEVSFLKEEKEETQKMILVFEAVPLGHEFNRQITEAMKTFEKILESQESLNFTFYSRGGARFMMFYLSDWEWLHRVGRMYLCGGEGPEDRRQGRLRDNWNYSEYVERKKNTTPTK